MWLYVVPTSTLAELESILCWWFLRSSCSSSKLISTFSTASDVSGLTRTHTQYYIILQNIKLFKSNVYIHYTNLSMVLLVLLSPEPDPRPSRTDCTMAKGRMGGSVQTPQETSSLHLCTPGLTGSSLIIIGHLSLYEQAMLQRIIKHYLFNTKMRTQDVRYIHMP